jgi:tetratricopeptide (TPR) repeat protein
VAGVVVLLATAIIALFINRIAVGQQQVRAEENFQMAREAVDGLLVQVSEDRLLNEPGMQPVRRDLLHKAQEFYQRFVEKNQNDPARQVDLANVLIKLGGIQGEVGDRGQALATLERAAGIFDQLVQRDPSVAEYRAGQGSCQLSLGVLCHTDNPVQAEAAWQKALSVFEALAQDYPSVSEYAKKLALCNNNRGALRERGGRYPEAEDFYRKALAIEQELASHEPRMLEYQRDLAGTHLNMGGVYRKMAQAERNRSATLWDKARDQYRQALTLGEELVRQAPLNLGYQFD